MKAIAILAIVVLICSCQSKKEAEKSLPGDGNVAVAAGNAEPVAHPLVDNKGKVMALMTFPANWKLHSEPGRAAFSGPNDVFVFHLPLRSYMHSADPVMLQAYSQNGGKIRPFTSAESIIREDFIPIAAREGSKLVRVYDAPEIARADSGIAGMMYTIGPRDIRYEAAVSEWKDRNGRPYAIIVHVNGSAVGGMMSWMYSAQLLDAPAAEYENAKKILIEGLASIRYNPRYFDEYNRNEMNMESASWAAHNQRMSQRQRDFDAQQQAFREKTSAINSSVMASYEARNAASDKSHNRFLNYIKDESTVANPADGKRYQVQSGSNQYWMNANGEYIGSNDPNYDPNRNQGAVQHTWTETEVVD